MVVTTSQLDVASGPPIISLRDVIKVYREADVETIALRGVDLDITPGEFVAIMGRSGSGKSTLLNLLSGADRPTAGKVLVAGVPLDRAGEAERTQLRGRAVGIVFQVQNLVPLLTLQENVVLSGRLAGRAISGPQAASLLERVGLADRGSHRPDALSGGEQQRAALACVLAGKPSVLLADEITGELDSRSAEQIVDLVRELHADGDLTVVMVTHDPDVAAQAQRVVHLRDGRVAADTPVAVS